MFALGDEIGPYKLVDFLGRGAFGEVWLAERASRIASTRVALKLPFIGCDSFDEVRKEVELWSLASGHPNVIPVFEANVYDGQIIIASEYASGGSLQRLIIEKKFLKPSEALKLVKGILSGLGYLHSKRIIHRDIKPANILLQDNVPKLSDFGISRVIMTDYSIETVSGTPTYMAPEAFDGIRNESTDLWSVSVVFYEMINGCLPFNGNSVPELISAIISKEPNPCLIRIPHGLELLIQKGLSKDPTQRHQSVASYLAEISRVEESLQSHRAGLFDSQPSKETVVGFGRASRIPNTNGIRASLFLLALIPILIAVFYGLVSFSSRSPSTSPSPLNSVANQNSKAVEVVGSPKPIAKERASNTVHTSVESNSNQVLKLGIKKERRPK